jgi:hypothetical protein
MNLYLEMKALFVIIYLGLVGVFIVSICCSCENSVTSRVNQNDTFDVVNPYEIYSDSISYNFIWEAKLIDTSDILNEELINFELDYIKYIMMSQSSNTILKMQLIENDLYPKVLYQSKDSLGVERQVAYSKDKKWSIYQLQYHQTLNKYDNWKIKNTTFNWDKFKKSNFGCVISLSAPIFNESRDEVVIIIEKFCHYTIGTKDVYYFRLDEEYNWKIAKKWNLWIS